MVYQFSLQGNTSDKHEEEGFILYTSVEAYHLCSNFCGLPPSIEPYISMDHLFSTPPLQENMNGALGEVHKIMRRFRKDEVYRPFKKIDHMRSLGQLGL